MRPALVVGLWSVVLVLLGCSGDKPSSLRPPAAGTGSISFTVAWPDAQGRTRGGARYIPPSTQSISIVATQHGAQVAQATIARQPGETTATVTLPGIPAGETRLLGRALSGRGTELARGEATVMVASGKTVAAELRLKSLRYVFDRVIAAGTGSGDGQFRQPSYMAFDTMGRLHVVDWNNDRLQMLNANGAFLGKRDLTAMPHGIAFNSKGEMYIASMRNFKITPTGEVVRYGEDVIRKYAPNGTLLSSIKDDLENPWACCVDSADNLYVTDTLHFLVKKYSSSGGKLLEWGNKVEPDWEHPGTVRFGPSSVDTDRQGRVYVGFHDDSCVKVFDAAGNFLYRIGSDEHLSFHWVMDVKVVDNARLYIADHAGNRVVITTLDGEYLSEFGLNLEHDGTVMGCVHGVAIDHTGNVYISDFVNDRLLKFLPILDDTPPLPITPPTRGTAPMVTRCPMLSH